MKNKRRIWMTLLLAAVFCVSTVMLLRQSLDKAAGEDSYSDALAIASGTPAPARETAPPTQPRTAWIPAPVEEDDPYLQEMAEVDLAALRQVNPDVLGWIRIPETKINYPLMRGEDNDYYLNRTWQGYRNTVGSIFLECQNSPELTDFNTILYGHNMRDGSMFAALRNYTTDFWKKHPYVYLKTDAGVFRYEIFAAYKAELESPAYGLSFRQSKTRGNFLTHAVENTVIETGIYPELTDRILTLSTCTPGGYADRWVVQARLRMMEVEAK